MNPRTLTAFALAASALVWPVGVCSATPGSGVTAKLKWEHTVGDTHLVYREITIAPGGTTGWHFHEGLLIGKVISGTLTHYDHDCAVDGVYRAGDSVIERPGADKVHYGANEGTEPMVLEVLYIMPKDAPPANDAPAPC